MVGIIAEYNPFHNGHLYHLLEAKRLSGQRAAVVMSGGFTQRGEPALLDKRLRTEAALKCGASIVLELPAMFACAGAQTFARGAVGILSASGIVGSLCFGSETDNLPLLSAIAAVTASEPPSYREQLKAALNSGMSFARAREQTAANLSHPDAALVLRSPNNILAVEYLAAISKTGSSLTPITVKRLGAGYHDTEICGGTASASYIRRAVKAGIDCVSTVMPPESLEIMTREAERLNALPDSDSHLDKYSSILHYILLEEKFKCYLENEKIYGKKNREEESLWGMISKSAARPGIKITEIISTAPARRFTKSRIRREITRRILNLPSEHSPLCKKPAYIRVLGFRRDDADVLGHLVKKSSLPVITNLKNADKTLTPFPEARDMLQSDLFAQSMYALGQGAPCNEAALPMVIV